MPHNVVTRIRGSAFKSQRVIAYGISRPIIIIIIIIIIITGSISCSSVSSAGSIVSIIIIISTVTTEVPCILSSPRNNRTRF
jgi:hypothetical protein